MANTIAWILFVLGIGHVAYGLVMFRAPLIEAVAGGFVGQFKRTEARRTAFWFVIFGPMLMLAGQTAIHAVAQADFALLKLIGVYTLIISAIGLLAFPKSPFLAAFPVAVLLMAVGYGWLA